MRFSIFFAIIFVAIVVFFILMGVAVARGQIGKHRQDRANAVAPVLTSQATIVGKRSQTTGSSGQYGGSTSTEYYATFELPSGERLEFELSGAQFGLVVEGDRGNLTWQGTWLKDFRRELDYR